MNSVDRDSILRKIIFFAFLITSTLTSCLPRYGPALLGTDLPYMEMPAYEDSVNSETYITAVANNGFYDESGNGGNDSYEIFVYEGFAFPNINLGAGVFGYAGKAKGLIVSDDISYNPPHLTDDKNFYGWGLRGQINYILFFRKESFRFGAKAAFTKEYGDYMQFRKVAALLGGIENLRNKDYFYSYAMFGEIKMPVRSSDKLRTGSVGAYFAWIFSTMDAKAQNQTYPMVALVGRYKKINFQISAAGVFIDDIFLSTSIGLVIHSVKKSKR